VPYQSASDKQAAEQAAAQKRMDEGMARGYIRKHPDWKKHKPVKQSDTDGQKNGMRGGCGPQAGNPTQSDPIIPAAMEAEVARLNRGDPPTLRFRLRRTSTGQAGAASGDENKQSNGNDGTNGTNGAAEWDREDRPDWDPEDEMILKEAAEAHQRREAARKAEEEYRLWRVDFGFEEPTEEDIALGRTKRKRWNKAETSNIQQPTPNV
jgi:hypothetical protein